MRIGVTIPNVHETLAERTMIEAVGRTADELGFDSIWCNARLAIPSATNGAGAQPAYATGYGEQRRQHIYEPLIVLAYLAAVTRRVLLGTSVYLLPLRNPVLAAKQIVSLDRLSEGDLPVRLHRRLVAVRPSVVSLPQTVGPPRVRGYG
jgi:alkanesulfonate monooxygenase SsuD/methylene tetrahydromethanopterin reductase-like flavin-dependent oxidoreductase (luciferase family)